MHILVINFKAENTAEEYDKATAEIAPVFAEIEGLIIKHFLFNHEEKTYGGCYQFESKAALDAYMAGDVFKMIMENPDWSDHMVRSYEVHAEATEIQEQAKVNAA